MDANPATQEPSDLSFVGKSEVTQAKSHMYMQIAAIIETGQDAYGQSVVSFPPTSQFVTTKMALTGTPVQIDTEEIPPGAVITQVVLRGENVQWAGRENDEYIDIIGQEILDIVINPEHDPADFPKPHVRASGSSAEVTIIYSTTSFKEPRC